MRMKMVMMTLLRNYEGEIKDGVVYMYLRKRDGREYTVLFDEEELCWLAELKSSWYVNEYSPGKVRVQGRVLVDGVRTRISMHQLFVPNAELVDHINNNALDNRKCNLRPADKSQNAQNSSNLRSDNKSGVRGVWWRTSMSKWCAQVNVDGVCFTLGYFKLNDLKEAEKAVKKARAELMPYSPEAAAKEEDEAA
jgi:hypothetical protein